MARRNQPPDRLPPEIRDHSEVVRACREWNIGRLFRFVNNLTEEPAKFTVTHIGRLCGLSVSRVGEYMNDTHRVTAVGIIERIADGLQVPGERFGLASRPWEPSAIAETSMQDTQRNILKQHLESNSLLPPDRDLAAMRAMSAAFQIADRQVGGGRLYGTVARYLASEVAPQLVGVECGERTADVFSAAASLTEIAGWMAHDGGADEQARRHFDQAFRLSSAAENLVLSANVCASMSHLATQLNSPRDAIRIADAGLSRTRKVEGASGLRARLFTMRARGLALNGEATACVESLRVAEKTLDTSGTEDAVEWIANFDHGSLASEAALCLRSLGNLGGAERQASKAIELRNGDRIRSRALAQLTLASVLVGRGRAAEAATVGVQVCSLVPKLNSARVMVGLTDLTRSLQAYATVSEVRDLLDQWNSVTTLAKSDCEGRPWPV